jgi:hypothetical protein
MQKHKHATEQIFLKTCDDIKPDWVFLMLDVPWISTEILLKAKVASPNSIFTNWTGDVREEPKQGVIEIGKVVDITLIVNTAQIEQYKKLGLKRVEFLQAGVKPCFFPLPENKREVLRNKLQHDIVFCANNAKHFPGHVLRNEVSVKLNRLFGKRFAIYGRGWGNCRSSSRGMLPYDEQQEVYNGSKIALSINNFNDVDMYFSARQLCAMASGTITISTYIPGLEKYFDNNKDLVWFKTADECVDLVKYYLEHEDEARQIGINGSKKVLENNTRIVKIRKMKERLGIK